jgi:hypothetical protein
MTRTQRLSIPLVLLRIRCQRIAAGSIVAPAVLACSLIFASASSAAQVPVATPAPDAKASAASAVSPYLRPLNALIAVRDAVAAEKPLTPMEDRVLDRVFRRREAAGQATAVWFMRSAVIRERLVNGAILGGFYNPLSDTWLLARFDYVNGSWRLSDAFLAESPEALPHPWFIGGHEALKELTQSYGLAQRGFADPKAPFSPISADTVQARAAPWLKSLDEWHGDKSAVKTAAKVAAAIANGKVKNLGLSDKAGRQLLDQLPASARSSLEVEGIATRKDGATLLMVSPNAPSVLVVVKVNSKGGLLGVAAVDLAKAKGVGA